MTNDIQELINTCDLVPSEDVTNRLLDICARLLERISELEAELKATQRDVARSVEATQEMALRHMALHAHPIVIPKENFK